MDDLLSEFLTETSESLDSLDNDLVKLEENPNDPDLLGNIFRLVHTIKGTCGFLGLPRLESLAHAGENVLGKIRDGELDVTPYAIDLVLAALDKIKEILSVLEATESEPEGMIPSLKISLTLWRPGKRHRKKAPPPLRLLPKRRLLPNPPLPGARPLAAWPRLPIFPQDRHRREWGVFSTNWRVKSRLERLLTFSMKRFSPMTC